VKGLYFLLHGWVPGALSSVVKLNTHLHLLPILRIRGAIPPLPIRLHGVVFSLARGQLCALHEQTVYFQQILLLNLLACRISLTTACKLVLYTFKMGNDHTWQVPCSATATRTCDEMSFL
jgi:hypothetical protein